VHWPTRRAFDRGSWPTILVLASITALCAPTMSATAAVPTVKLRGTSSVRDADNPARHAYHLMTRLNFAASSDQETDNVDLPNATGKIFVIEVVSEICFVPTGQKLANVTLATAVEGDTETVTNYFPPVFTASFGGTTDEYSANTLTRLYHLVKPTGLPLSLQINRNSSTGVGHCNISLSGYLIDPNL
jgi:hypothetical protein